METFTEFRLLAQFVQACQNPKISDAAAELGVTTPALSTALKNLEKRLEMKLFSRQGGHLGPLPSAFWLYRDACALLHLERQARQATLLPVDRLARLVVDIDLSFAIGRFSKAVDLTIQQMADRHPDTLIDCNFTSIEGPVGAERMGQGFLARIPEDRAAQVWIGYRSPDQADDDVEEEPLLQDQWLAVGAMPGEDPLDVGNSKLAVLRMKPALMAAITQYAEDAGLENRLRFIAAEPDRIGQLLSKHPDLRFLIPGSMIAARLGLSQGHFSALAPELRTPIVGRAGGARAGQARTFLKLLRGNLGRAELNVTFDPAMTMRQVHLFNLACQCGGISAAARFANLAQPSVSSQLNKLEKTLGTPLLHRRSDGTGPTETGARLHPFTQELESRQDLVLRKARDFAAHTQARVSLGTLPSSGYDSALTAKVAETVVRIHERHPNWRVHVREASNTSLYEMVRSGGLNLAIVGMAGPQVGRIALGPGEPLSVVANPEVDLGEGGPISLAEMCKLPMVLGPRYLSIHDSVMTVLRTQGLSPSILVEVGSLALAIAMVRRARMCTILPVSSVRRDVEAGRLTARLIDSEEISGKLSVIFSVDRTLSDAERSIVRELIKNFGTAEDPVE